MKNEVHGVVEKVMVKLIKLNLKLTKRQLNRNKNILLKQNLKRNIESISMY
jgi:hypothetical protein